VFGKEQTVQTNDHDTNLEIVELSPEEGKQLFDDRV
jgi:hypothetical protein